MPRRTGLDTIFDNQGQPTPEDLRAQAEAETFLDEMEDTAAVPFVMDEEDQNQAEEGLPGDEAPGEEEPISGAMDPDDFQSAISEAISNAEDYIDMEVSPDREEAAKYYRAELFGNEEDGRSKVVMSEVRDTVLAVMPDLLRVFCGTKNAVEFLPNFGTPSQLAKFQTAYVNHIIMADNQGFTIFYNAFKDALVRNAGIFHWWHEEIEVVTTEDHTGLSESAYALLQMETRESSSEDENLDYEIEVVAQRPDTTAPDTGPDILGEEDQAALPGMEALPPPQSFIRDVRVFRRVIKKRHRVVAVPPEEFILTPIASDDLDQFPFVGRRMLKTIGELVALGHDENDIREAVGAGDDASSSSLSQNSERMDRQGEVMEKIFDAGFSAHDPASEYIKYVEGFALIDRDGDGIPERVKIAAVGDNNKVIFADTWGDEVPFAVICPDPEPHAPFGYSMASQVMDMQEIKSETVRAVLDSLAESIFGRTAIVEGQVNIDDALSGSRDQLIRIKSQGAIQRLSSPFNGMNAIPVLEYLDTIKARRTGITMGPSGLDPQVLQSTSTDAVQATVDASQSRSEMIARIFAETGLKRMMRGLLKQVVRHQDRKRSIRLNGRPVEVDPRSFVADLDLYSNVGLGRGTEGKRIQGLMQIFAQQKEVMQTYGEGNPYVHPVHISNTMEDFVAELGFSDVSRYMNVIDENASAEMVEVAKNTPPKPTPEELLHDAQTQETQSKVEIARINASTKIADAQAKDDFQRDKLDQDFYLKAAELLGRFGIEANEQEMRARMETNRAADADATQAIQAGQAALPQPPQNGA